MAILCPIEHDDFRAFPFRAELRQITYQHWVNGQGFWGYEQLPRPAAGLVFVLSDMRIRYTFADGQKLTLRQGDVFYAPKGSMYTTVVSGTQPLRSYTVNFDIYTPAGEDCLLAPTCKILLNHTPDTFIAALDALRQVTNRPDYPHNRLKVQAGLLTLLDAVADAAHQNNAAYYPIKVGADALMAQWNQNKKIADYAAMCGISVSYFHALFHEWTGMSPAAFRTSLRIRNAKNLLVSTSMPVRFIAGQVGFDDPFYFSRVFTTAVGMTPTAYRRRKMQIKR